MKPGGRDKSDAVLHDPLMNGPPSPYDRQSPRTDLASRLAEIRRELYGDHGGPMLAHALKLPFHLWTDYERGRAMPGEVLLRFLEQTGAEPHWLLTGRGPKYHVGP